MAELTTSWKSKNCLVWTSCLLGIGWRITTTGERRWHWHFRMHFLGGNQEVHRIKISYHWGFKKVCSAHSHFKIERNNLCVLHRDARKEIPFYPLAATLIYLINFQLACVLVRLFFWNKALCWWTWTCHSKKGKTTKTVWIDLWKEICTLAPATLAAPSVQFENSISKQA